MLKILKIKILATNTHERDRDRNKLLVRAIKDF